MRSPSILRKPYERLVATAHGAQMPSTRGMRLGALLCASVGLCGIAGADAAAPVDMPTPDVGRNEAGYCRYLPDGSILYICQTDTAFVSPAAGKVDVLVVGGGGAGGFCAGGGGAGGQVVYRQDISIALGERVPVTVGLGGEPLRNPSSTAGNGGDSSFGDVVAVGGGRGGAANNEPGPLVGTYGGNGGGGGGCTWYNTINGTSMNGEAGLGGYAGGSSYNYVGGGGAGAGENGQSAYLDNGKTYAGKGGDGVACAITGKTRVYGGGGGGGKRYLGEEVGAGGAGGGGTGGANNGNSTQPFNGTAGVDGLGGGGGGGGGRDHQNNTIEEGYGLGGAGGRGAVIIRLYPQTFATKTLTEAKTLATGGVVSQDAGYATHVFTESGTLTLPAWIHAEVFIVGGGGGGSGDAKEKGDNHYSEPYAGAGGGGGEVAYLPDVVLPAGTLAVTVGAGGAQNENGGESSLGWVRALGGGGGGLAGACGGGADDNHKTPPEGEIGYAGGNYYFNSAFKCNGGGGGGMGSAGGDATTSSGGNGGAGVACAMTGDYYGMLFGGGGGGGYAAVNYEGAFGTGAARGGDGATWWDHNGLDAAANSGSGGGGASGSNHLDLGVGGHGGSGIVIVRYRTAGRPAIEKCIGGTVSRVDGAYLHTFTENGTFIVPESMSADVLIVGGGGAGGFCAGGGGAGGQVKYMRQSTLAPGTYQVVVGAGGVALRNPSGTDGNGGASSFGDSIALGGGRGGAANQEPASLFYGNGGGAGGCTWYNNANGYTFSGASGDLGHAGGNSYNFAGGGGAGAGADGTSAYENKEQTNEEGHTYIYAGNGGAGVVCDITGESVAYGGGGGGGIRYASYNRVFVGAGGAGGGGAGATNNGNSSQPYNGTAGVDGLGGGGGGGGGRDHQCNLIEDGYGLGGNGGSGIVMIRYTYDARATILLCR